MALYLKKGMRDSHPLSKQPCGSYRRFSILKEVFAYTPFEFSRTLPLKHVDF